MLALKILDIKDFMNKLLLGDNFDMFEVIEASITTFSTFSIDGSYKKDFFDTDKCTSLEANQIKYASWNEIKPFCYSVIRGKRTPLHFKFILQLPYLKIIELLKINNCNISSELIGGLFLNIQYKNKELYCTTGISYQTFVTDSTLKHLWDSTILDYLRNAGIPFESM